VALAFSKRLILFLAKTTSASRRVILPMRTDLILDMKVPRDLFSRRMYVKIYTISSSLWIIISKKEALVKLRRYRMNFAQKRKFLEREFFKTQYKPFYFPPHHSGKIFERKADFLRNLRVLLTKPQRD
jgi:hypothetical protein